jgi:hypothetical protein
MKSLVKAISDYFIDCTYGTVWEIMDYVNDAIKYDRIFNKTGRAINKASRITVHDNLGEVYSFGVVDKDGPSKPSVYFFKPNDESLVKPLLLNMDKRIENLFRNAQKILNNRRPNTEYYDILRDAFHKSELGSFDDYLTNIKSYNDNLKEMIWDRYLIKKIKK